MNPYHFLLYSSVFVSLAVASAFISSRRLERWLKVKRECAWCRKRLGGNPKAKETSHGICRPCMRKQLEEASTHAKTIIGEQFGFGPPEA